METTQPSAPIGDWRGGQVQGSQPSARNSRQRRQAVASVGDRQAVATVAAAAAAAMADPTRARPPPPPPPPPPGMSHAAREILRRALL